MGGLAGAGAKPEGSAQSSRGSMWVCRLVIMVGGGSLMLAALPLLPLSSKSCSAA